MITHLLSSIRDLITPLQHHGDDRRAAAYALRHHGRTIVFYGLVCFAPLTAQATDKPTMTAIPPELVDPMFFNDSENETSSPSSSPITPRPAATSLPVPDKKAEETTPDAKPPTNDKVEIIPKAPAVSDSPGKIKLPKIDLPKAPVNESPKSPVNDAPEIPVKDAPQTPVKNDVIPQFNEDYSPEALKTLLNPQKETEDNLTLLPSSPALPLTPMPEAAPPATLIPTSPPAETAPPPAKDVATAPAPAVNPENTLWHGSLMFPADRILLLNQAARREGTEPAVETAATAPGKLAPGVVYPTTSPVFYLNSILYFSSTNWTIWLNGSKISYSPTPQSLSPIPDLEIISVSPKEITLTWTTKFLDHMSPQWSSALSSDGDGSFSNDDDTVSLNADKNLVHMILRPNQAFAVYYMGIYEGDVEPTILPPPTAEQTPFLENTTDEKIDKLKNLITQ